MNTKSELVEQIMAVPYGNDGKEYFIYDGTGEVKDNKNNLMVARMEVLVGDINYYIPIVGLVNKKDFPEIKENHDIQDKELIKKLNDYFNK